MQQSGDSSLSDEDSLISSIITALQLLKEYEDAEHIDVVTAASALIGLRKTEHISHFTKNTLLNYLRNIFPQTINVSESLHSISSLRTMMAPWTYTNEEFLELEIDTLFKHEWLLAGHISALKNNGDYLTFDALGERVIIIKGNDGEVRGFHNVCRHRGSRLSREPQGSFRNSIVCPFHGWTYKLDGSLKNVPAAHTFKDLNKSEHHLKGIDVEIWHGFVFFRFGGNGASISQQLTPIEEYVAPYRLEEMLPLTPLNRETVDVNWKVVHDIDNEGYHVPIGHPGLHELFGREYKDREIDGVSCTFGHIQNKPSRNWSVSHYQKLLPKFDHLSKDKQKLWFYFGVFPNLAFEIHPDCAEFYMTLPISASQTLYVSQSFALPTNDRRSKAAAYLSQRINRQVGFEDATYVNWIQEGLSSSVFPQGTLSSIEDGVSDFHKRIQKRIPVGTLEAAPALGKVRTINDAL